MANHSDLVAQFLAKGGQVTKVSEGTRAIESDRTIYKAMREGTRAVADGVAADRRAEARAHRVRDAFDAAKYDGWSDDDAYRYAQEAE